MIKTVCKFIFWLKNWKLQYEDTPELRRCVMMAAPHTSNWDFVFLTASFSKMKIPYRITIKKEWMRFPFNLVIRPLGGLGIDRTPVPGRPKSKMVDVMSELFEEYKDLCMVVTPEGTRKKTTRWKTGFYQVAVKAKVPIALSYIDYEKKVTGIYVIFHPTGNMENDMRLITSYYKDAKAKFDEKFSPDIRYL
jgi:1-acyl-sn-glycerol-3-phosphate acyltransferase